MAPPPALPLDLLSEPALALDPAGRVLAMNSAARRRWPGTAPGTALTHLAADPPEALERLLRLGASSSAPAMAALALRTAGTTERRQVRLARVPGGPDAASVVVMVVADAVDVRFRALTETVDRLRSALRARAAEAEGLSEALQQKRVLFQELQHRMKNNMHLVGVLMRMTARDHDSPAVRACLDAGMRRIQALTRTQEAIYEAQGMGELLLGPFLERIVRGIAAGLGTRARIGVEVMHDLALEGEAAHNLALIVNELVTNAIKYGRSDEQAEVMVRVAAAPGEGAVLEVVDNGPGFDPAATRQGTGLGLVEALALQLGGSLAIGAAPGGGVLVRLDLPAALWLAAAAR